MNLIPDFSQWWRRLGRAVEVGWHLWLRLVVDEAIGNFINVHVLPHADVVVSSLTKIFSGDCNVMGGSAISNPEGRYYQHLKSAFEAIARATIGPRTLCSWSAIAVTSWLGLRESTTMPTLSAMFFKHIFLSRMYTTPSRALQSNFNDDCRIPTGGCGGLLCFTFHEEDHVVAFFDRTDTAKGPSLGQKLRLDFTLCCPSILLGVGLGCRVPVCQRSCFALGLVSRMRKIWIHGLQLHWKLPKQLVRDLTFFCRYYTICGSTHILSREALR